MENFILDGGANEERTITHHHLNMHDAKEDEAGERTDLATGKPIDNSGQAETADTKLHVIRTSEDSEDVLGKIEDPEDAAAKWLRENDPNHNKKAA